MKKKRLVFFFTLLGVGVSFFVFSLKDSPRINIIFQDNAYRPFVISAIQGKNYYFYLDSGQSRGLCLLRPVLEKLKKTDLNRIADLMDFKGNVYQSPTYSVPDVKMMSQESREIEVEWEDFDFHKNTSLWMNKRDSNPSYHGCIGLSFFSKPFVLFDFPNCALFLGDSLKDLKKKSRLKIENFVSVPFKIEMGLLVAFIETDLGRHKVILDTGASFGLLRKRVVPSERIRSFGDRSCFKARRLQIGDCEYGKWKFAVADFSEKMEVDGILGVDFFLENAVLFDFENQLVYFAKPQGRLATQWRRAKFYVTRFFVREFSKLTKVEDLGWK